MVAANESGSMVLLAGDSGERYLDTYYDDRWVASQGHDLASHLHVILRYGCVVPLTRKYTRRRSKRWSDFTVGYFI